MFQFMVGDLGKPGFSVKTSISATSWSPLNDTSSGSPVSTQAVPETALVAVAGRSKLFGSYADPRIWRMVFTEILTEFLRLNKNYNYPVNIMV